MLVSQGGRSLDLDLELILFFSGLSPKSYTVFCLSLSLSIYAIHIIMKMKVLSLCLLFMFVIVCDSDNENEPNVDQEDEIVGEENNEVVEEVVVLRDPNNDAVMPPHVFKTTTKKSGREFLTLIVDGRYKFLKRKFLKGKFYFECNVPQCGAKAHASGQMRIKILPSPALTLSTELAMEVATSMYLTVESDWLKSVGKDFFGEYLF